MSRLIDCVEQYISEQDTEHAIMIRGDWGCGKTYFWRNTLCPRLMDPPNAGSLTTKPVLVYVSIFGLTIEQANKRVLLNLAMSLGDGYVRHQEGRLSRVCDFLKDSWPIRKLAEPMAALLISQSWHESDGAILEFVRQMGKQIVICIDDFERADADPVKLLGLVNRLSEQMKCHVVILCNESELLNTDDANYRRRKEKAISRTFDFDIDPCEAIPSLIKSISGAAEPKSFLNEKLEMINGIVSAAKIGNLRIIKRALSSFAHHVYPAWQLLDAQDRDEERVCDSLRFLISCCVEVDLKAISVEEFSKLRTSSGSFINYLLWADPKDKQEDQEGHPRLNIQEYFQIYFEATPMFNGCRRFWYESLFVLVTQGYVDRNELLAELQPPVEARLSPLDSAVKLLTEGFWEANDNEFQAAFAMVWDALGEEKLLNIGTYFRLVSIMGFFAKNQMIDQTEEAVYERFQALLPNMIAAAPPDLGTDLFGLHFSPANDTEKDLIKSASESLKRRQKDRKVHELQSLFDSVNSSPDPFFELLGSRDGSYLHEPVMTLYDPADVANWLLTTDNAMISRFQGLIRARYHSYSNVKDFVKDDLSFLDGVLEVLAVKTDELGPSLKKGILMNLMSHIRSAAEKLR